MKPSNVGSALGLLIDARRPDVPTDPATLYALTGAISRKAKPDNADWMCEYLNRMPPEFSVMAMKDCMARNADISNTRPFISWATKHQEVLS